MVEGFQAQFVVDPAVVAAFVALAPGARDGAPVATPARAADVASAAATEGRGALRMAWPRRTA